MSYPSRPAFAAQLRALQAGIDADLTDVESVIISEVTYSIPALRAKIDEYLAADRRVTDTFNAYKAAVDAGRASRASAETFRAQLQSYVIGRHKKGDPVLAKYGFSPPAPREVSAATKALSALRGKATRKERGTMGKKQKSKIKGTVDPKIVAKLLGTDSEKKSGAVKGESEAADKEKKRK